MSVLIIKIGASGDVVRTTPLLRRLDGAVTWITAGNNLALLEGIDRKVRCVSWEDRRLVAGTTYDLVINLEDDEETSRFLKELKFKQVFGAHLKGDDNLTYTSDSRSWFDLSVISNYGRKEADRLKLLNRRTYQDLIFDGLGLGFNGEKYLSAATATDRTAWRCGYLIKRWAGLADEGMGLLRRVKKPTRIGRLEGQHTAKAVNPARAFGRCARSSLSGLWR